MANLQTTLLSLPRVIAETLLAQPASTPWQESERAQWNGAVNLALHVGPTKGSPLLFALIAARRAYEEGASSTSLRATTQQVLSLLAEEFVGDFPVVSLSGAVLVVAQGILQVAALPVLGSPALDLLDDLAMHFRQLTPAQKAEPVRMVSSEPSEAEAASPEATLAPWRHAYYGLAPRIRAARLATVAAGLEGGQRRPRLALPDLQTWTTLFRLGLDLISPDAEALQEGLVRDRIAFHQIGDSTAFRDALERYAIQLAGLLEAEKIPGFDGEFFAWDPLAKDILRLCESVFLSVEAEQVLVELLGLWVILRPGSPQANMLTSSGTALA
jgi:hypothetical protein